MINECLSSRYAYAIVLVIFTSLNNGVMSTILYNAKGLQIGVHGESRIDKKAMSSNFERFDSNEDEEKQENGFQQSMESKRIVVYEEDGENVEEEKKEMLSIDEEEEQPNGFQQVMESKRNVADDDNERSEERRVGKECACM